MATLTAFPVVSSSLDLRGEQFKSNKAAWSPVLQKFEYALKSTTVEGNERSLNSHQTRGQLLRGSTLAEEGTVAFADFIVARDRVALLLDPDSPFLELCSFAGFGLPDSSPCASLIVGIGSVRYVCCKANILLP